MIILAFILLLISICKVLFAFIINFNEIKVLELLTTPDEYLLKVLVGIIATDGLIGLILSLYILNGN